MFFVTFPCGVLGQVWYLIDCTLESTCSDNIDLFDSNYINLFMLLYADGAVFFSKSHVYLQDMLNKLHEYSQTWDLEVNTSKTKIMIFEKGRPTSTEFYNNNTYLENVENFKYLGVKFYNNGCWNRTQKCLSEYGSFALHNLYRLFQDVKMCTKEKFKLFDTFVGPVLSYACEVWGFHGAPPIENVFIPSSADIF